ncbi:AraC family ligand binding domain-containing protein [uncultured Pontibacter sp.]|uniref:cupin domain-containing protein n=1 Tax=uncultured Pontibacter sp. TaxID=453356 RepID=UPI00261D0AAB|nr:AraC family ligand binding domain-containing protein [uncultured Pontibacter sp.]
MAQEQLPIYRIEDFKSGKQHAKFFYLSALSDHLREHKFVQKPHKHSFFIVMFVTNGTGTHTIDFEEYPVNPGAVFFLAPGQVHSWKLSEDADGFILFFTQEYYLAQKQLYSFPFFNTHAGNVPLMLPEAMQRQLTQVVLHMQQEYLQQLQFKDDILRDYLDILLVRLQRLYIAARTEVASAAPVLPALLQLQRLIDKHYKEHQPVSFYADKLNTTSRHLN